MRPLHQTPRNISLLLGFTCAVVLLTSATTLADRSEITQPSDPVAAVIGADGVQRLEITLDSYAFTPAHIIVASGKPVEFTLKNVAAAISHNFRIDAPDTGMSVDEDVGAGKTATVSFLPAKPGIYEFYCDKKLPFFPSHRDKGMLGKLEVR